MSPILIIGFSIASYFFLKALYSYIRYKRGEKEYQKLIDKNHYENTKAALGEYGVDYTPEQAKETMDIIRSVVNKNYNRKLQGKKPQVAYSQRVVENPDGTKRYQILANGEVHGEVFGVTFKDTQLIKD